jgi:hypothetical protein
MAGGPMKAIAALALALLTAACATPPVPSKQYAVRGVVKGCNNDGHITILDQGGTLWTIVVWEGMPDCWAFADGASWDFHIREYEYQGIRRLAVDWIGKVQDFGCAQQ